MIVYPHTFTYMQEHEDFYRNSMYKYTNDKTIVKLHRDQ